MKAHRDIGHGVARPSQVGPKMRDRLVRLSRAEGRALLACAIGDQPSRNDVRWDAVVEVARYHRVAPLVAECLQDNSLSEETKIRLADFNRRSDERLARAGRGLTRILQAAQQKCLPLIAFKGPALSQQLYAHPSHRTYYDIDLAVRREDLESAEALMCEVGYEMPPLKKADLLWMVGRRPASDPEVEFDHEETRRLWLANHFHMPFVPKDTDQGVRVDLHWSLFQARRVTLPMHEMWERAVPTQVVGEHALTFSPPDNLIYLCLHAAMEGYHRVRLIKLVDIVKLAEQLTPAQWQQVAELVHRYGIQHIFSVGLQVSFDAFSHRLPEPAQDLVIGGFRMRLLRALLSERALLSCSFPAAEAAWNWALGEPAAGLFVKMIDSFARQCARRILKKEAKI